MKKCDDLQVGDIIWITNLDVDLGAKITDISKLDDYRIVFVDHVLYPLAIHRDQMVLTNP